MNWIYHPTESAKIVNDAEYHNYLANGWFDTPDCKKENVLCETLSEKNEKTPKKRGRPARSINTENVNDNSG